MVMCRHRLSDRFCAPLLFFATLLPSKRVLRALIDELLKPVVAHISASASPGGWWRFATATII